jgi:hypothetical protein
MSSKKFADVLPLNVFIRKGQVIQAYRALLKAASQIEDSSLKGDIRSQIIQNFRQNSNLERSQISIALREAHDHLKTIQNMQQRHAIPKDSWLNSSTEDDVKGRVGKGWPWQK